MSLKTLLKERLKSACIAVCRAPRLQRSMERLVFLALFDEWCKAHPCRILDERMDLHASVADARELADSIDYLEFGVFRGATIRWWCERNRHPESRFVGFDTFTGLPEDWTADHPKSTFSTGGEPPLIDDPRCSFQVGMFQDTLPEFLRSFQRQEHLVLHLDADLFSSTLFVLIQFAPILRPGDIIIFDEFHNYMDEFRALHFALKAHWLELEAIGATAGYGGRGYGRVALKVMPPAASC